MTWILSLALAAPSTFDVPVQGHLTDALGAPLAGTHTLAFTLRGGVSGTDLCHTQTLSATFDGGRFGTHLSVTPAQVCGWENLHLAVAVDGGAPSEAVPLGWALQAAFAADAEHAADADEADHAADASLFDGLATSAFARWASGVAQGLGIANQVAVTDASGNLTTVASLPLAQGGTGATTASGAFAALSPQTTKGDLIVRGATGPVRLAAGADGQVLTASSATATGLTWASPSGGSGATAASLTTASSPPSGCSGGSNVGAVYFDTTLNQARVCNGTAWVALGAGTSGQPGGSAADAYASCEAIFAGNPSATNGLYWIDPNGGLTADAFLAYCLNDIAGGGWTLAMNLDTSDGQVRDWFDGFWSTTNAIGTAATGLTGDYRNQTLYTQPVGQVLVLVHKEGAPIGWRAWNTAAQLGMDQWMRHESSYYPGAVTSASIASNISALDANEAFVRPEGQIHANVRHGATGSSDWARLRSSGLSTSTDNAQFGIGSWMDSNSGQSYPLCEAGTMLAWSSYFCMGQDRRCPGNCGNTTGGGRDIDYDYAFFTRSGSSLAPLDPAVAGNSQTAPASSCLAIENARPTAPSGVYWIDPDGAGSAPAYQANCELGIQGGGWTQVLNLDTSDGTVRNWSDTGFWTSTTAGTGSALTALTADYKDLATFNRTGFTQILIVGHREGAQTIGWRAWNLANTNALATWMASALSTTPATLTNGVIAGDVAGLSSTENIIRLADNLRVNWSWGLGTSPDYARIRNNGSPTTDNAEWGLGSWMDANNAPFYPACEAGTNKAWNGGFCWGTDRTCTGNCGANDGSVEYQSHLDYAIYLR